MVAPQTGQCLCGDIKFRIDGAVIRTNACHCTQCRRWGGHYWPSADVNQDDLVLTHGAESIAWYDSSQEAERGFCIVCGSSLFWRRKQGDTSYVSVAMGTLNAPTGLSLDKHIFTEDKGDYYEITPTDTKK